MNLDFNTVLRSLSDLIEDIVARLPYVIVGTAVFALFAFLAWLVKLAIRHGGRRARADATLVGLLSRMGSGIVTMIGFFTAAVVIFPTFRPGDLIAGLGIATVAIGFAFKDILQNFLAGILILWRRPFVVGDQIKTLNYEGTVEEITTRSTRLRTYDGERAVLPNSDVYTNAMLVRTAYDKRRIHFLVGIGYADSIAEAQRVIRAALDQVAGVLREPEPTVYVGELAPSAVTLSVFFWTEPTQQNVLRVRDQVATAVKMALDRAGIEMPYPHHVVLLRDDPAGAPARAARRR